MRLNGRATTSADGITIALDQVYGNCPKYIATRHPMPRASAPRRAPASLERLTRADTAFVATRAPEGADVSHRGGHPGFLRVDGDTVSWPDFQGNAMFNTLGNLFVDPACGLTVVDPDDGTTLYVTGHATIAGDRRVTLEVQDAVQLDAAAPLRWWLERPGRYPSSA
jgi:hypothetical protein